MTTLAHYLLEQLADRPDQKELVLILSDIASIGKIISHQTNKAGLVDIFGSVGDKNASDEEQQKLDVFANDLCKNFLKKSGHFCAMASEEEEGIVDVGSGDYVIAFDPLDGSSNIDVNVSIGTIFSVYKRLSNIPGSDECHFWQSGRAQVLAGYILYGASTVIVFSFGDGVHEFTLDQSLGEFLLSRERLIIPKECKIYSVNEAYTPYFREKDRVFIEYLKTEKKCSTRYVGSIVADFHRNLIKGGIFLYPGVDKKGTGTYEGKLRLQYEAKPLAFLVEQAGGLATDGKTNILDIVSTKLHECVPLIIGNKDIVEEYLNN